MEWGEQMTKHQSNMLNATYQNSNYSFERENRKTLIIDIVIGQNLTFSTTLLEPFIIDKLSDIYLESFSTFAARDNDDNNGSSNRIGFLLGIDQFNIQNNSNNEKIFNKLFIPNEDSSADGTDETHVHKSKKLNYICSINPTKLYEISGTITDCNTSTLASAFADSSRSRFIAEFVIVSR